VAGGPGGEGEGRKGEALSGAKEVHSTTEGRRGDLGVPPRGGLGPLGKKVRRAEDTTTAKKRQKNKKAGRGVSRYQVWTGRSKERVLVARAQGWARDEDSF